MSKKYPYTNTGDDFVSHQDMYADSYKRQSNAYRPGVRSSSHEQKCSTSSSSRTADSTLQLPGMALSFLHSCGLDSSDLAHLAELPEHLITIETLPKLLLQVKERKMSSASSSRPSTSQPPDDTSTHVWESSSHAQPVEYPIDRSAHPVYPLPPEQVQNWQDRWGNPRRMSYLTTDTSAASSNVVTDYSISNNTDPYYDTTESPEASSHSFVDFGKRPLLSLRLEPPVTAPNRKEAADFNCKIPPTFPHMCCLCAVSVSSTKDWVYHAQGTKHAKRKLELVQKYPKWDQTVESARRAGNTEVYKVPSKKEASDFNGIIPPIYPYLCDLCKTTVFSEIDWSVHVTGGLHAKSQLDLLRKYPDWDGTIRSSIRNDNTSADRKDGTSKKNTSDLKTAQSKYKPRSRVVSFTPLPAGDGVTSELTAIAKRFGSIKKSLFLSNRGYVEMASITEAKKLVEHFSANQLKLKGKIIQVIYSCEYTSLRDADGNDKTQSRSSHTFSRSNSDRPSPSSRRSSEKNHSSPNGRHSSERNYSSPKRRRSSERTLSSPKIKSSSERTHSSPKRRWSSERTHSSPKRRWSSERTHSSPNRKSSSERFHSSPKRRRSSERTLSSPNRKGSSERTHSSPKRRRSSERTHSSPNRKGSSERTHSSPKRRRSSERTHSSPNRKSSSEKTHSSRSHNIKGQENSQKSKMSSSTTSQSCHPSSSATDKATKSSVVTEQDKSVSNSYVESMGSDSDLEGMQVIADDGEELVHDIDDNDSKRSEKENLPRPVDITYIHTAEQKNIEDPSNDDTTDGSVNLEVGQKFEENEDQDTKEDHDLDLENCVTLDEFTEENSSDCQASGEENVPSSETEMSKEPSDDVITSTNPSSDMIQNDKESELPEESTCKTAAEPNTSENLDCVDPPKEEQYTERVTDKLKEANNNEQSSSLNDNTDSSNGSLQTDEPIGTEFVRPVIAYFCNLCSALYASEEEAKEKHCRSPSHHEKVKEHNNKKGNSVENKKYGVHK